MRSTAATSAREPSRRTSPASPHMETHAARGAWWSPSELHASGPAWSRSVRSRIIVVILSGRGPRFVLVGTTTVTAEGLVKRYGEVKALDGLDLEIPEGTVLGLLGPNGAGKTTCVRVLTTLLQPDAGRAFVAGIDVLREPQKVRALIGVSGQSAAVDENLTGYENLVM